ncbi:MAG: HNH endonuclease [Rubrobacter sp.]|nr:HNH endonuclease [Rubrobacter sp.]
MLLSALDLFERGEVESNLVKLSPDLGELFARYWERVLPFGQRGNLALPFFHLRSDGFWHLLPQRGRAEILNSASQIRSLSRLEETVLGAWLDEALYELLCVPETRTFLRAILIETYFAPEIQESLAEQSTVNHEAFQYSNELLERRTDQAVKETLESVEVYRPAVRDQGFRRAIVTVYSHRCALCGIRLRTLDGHTVVDAAHIIPWSVNHDDRPANGMALCRTCHWTFDEGLLRVAPSYEILASAQLRVATNLPGYLSNLEGRGIVRPSKDIYWPDPESLRWHHENVFRR